MTDASTGCGASAPVLEKPNVHRFETVSIHRFRGLEHLELEDLGAINLFVGANDSGKTSVLEAVFLLCGLARGGLIVGIQNQRSHVVREFDDLSAIFHGLDVNRPIELSAVAPDSAERRTLSISAEHADAISGVIHQKGDRGVELHIPRAASSSPDRRSVLLYEAKIAGRAVEEPLSFTCQLAVMEDAQVNVTTPIHPDEREKYARKMLIRSRILTPGSNHDGEAISRLVEVMSRLVVEKKKDKLIEVMKKIDPEIQDISTSGDMAYIDTGLDKMLPITMFGNGVIRAADIICRCVPGNSDIILIDEVENGVHYKGLRELVRAIAHSSSSSGIQFFMTAHSLDVLRALRDVLNEDEFASFQPEVGCYVLARDRHRKVRSYRYDYGQFSHAMKHGIEIR